MRPTALKTESLKKLFVSIAGRKGISVVFDRECKTPHASSSGVITLPPPGAVDSDKFWMYAFHELGHLMEELIWTYKGIGKKLNLKDKLTMTVLNIIVDNLCEKNLFGEYEGVDDALSLGRSVMTQEYLDNKDSVWNEVEKDPIKSLIIGMMLWDVKERQDWMGHRMEALPVEDALSKRIPFIVSELSRISFLKRLSVILEVKDPIEYTTKLVLDILKILKYTPPPPEDSSEKTVRIWDEDGEDGEECDGTGKDVASDTKDSPEDTQKEKDEADTDGEGTSHPEWIHDPSTMTEEMLKEVISAIDAKLLSPPVDATKIRERVDSYASRYTEYIPWDEHRVIPLESSQGSCDTWLRRTIVHALGNSTVSKSISKYLKAMVTESFTYGQRRGRLHQKNIHRVVTGVPQPGYPPAIYKKKNLSVLKSDSTVTLLLDCSGSMSGSRYAIGAACCVALSETLTGLAIQHEVLGFTESSTLITYVMKPYGVPMGREKMLNVMSHGDIRMSNNADGESVLWAAERILSRKEQRKMLIVLSDGHPAGRFIGNGNKYLKGVCEMIEKKTKVDLVGIGISTNAVRSFYKDHVVVNNPKDLDSVLFGVLKRFLT